MWHSVSLSPESPLSLSLSALKMCLVPYPAYNYQSNFSKVKEKSVVKSEIVRRSCPGTQMIHQIYRHLRRLQTMLSWIKFGLIGRVTSVFPLVFALIVISLLRVVFLVRNNVSSISPTLLGLALSPKVHHLQPSSLEPRLVNSFGDSSSLGGQQSWPRLWQISFDDFLPSMSPTPTLSMADLSLPLILLFAQPQTTWRTPEK